MVTWVLSIVGRNWVYSVSNFRVGELHFDWRGKVHIFMGIPASVERIGY